MTRFGFVDNVLMAVIINPTEDEADALHRAGFLFVKSEIWNGLVKGLYIYISPDFNWSICQEIDCLDKRSAVIRKEYGNHNHGWCPYTQHDCSASEFYLQEFRNIADELKKYLKETK